MSEYPLPNDYDRAEKMGIVPLCCRAIECFRPTQFAAVGYPFVINSIGELWKYTECMHDGFGLTEPMDQYLISTLLMGGFTKQEFQEFKSIKAAVDDLAGLVGRRCEYPTNSIFLALNQARHISALTPPGSTIVELGGGAGYLGALLVLRGYRYVATDIAQALYLMQSHLISRVAPRGCIDLLDERYGVNELRALQPGQAAMIPWWRWVHRSIPAALSIDLATSNHNLLEMHPFSRLYHLSAVRNNLTPKSIGLVFEGWGDPSRNPTWTAVKDLADKGFVLAHNDRRITCFVPEGSWPQGSVLRYPLPLPTAGQPAAPIPTTAAIQPAPAQGRAIIEKAGKRLLKALFPSLLATVMGPTWARLDALSARVDNLPSARAFTPLELQYAATEFRDSSNHVSNAVMTMRDKERTDVALGLAEYRELMGSADLSTEDERFLAYIFRGTPLARPWIGSLPI
jgi:hypothetical protein